MATKATHESVTEPVGRDRKIRTALRTNQIVGFFTLLSEKKKLPYSLLKRRSYNENIS